MAAGDSCHFTLLFIAISIGGQRATKRACRLGSAIVTELDGKFYDT